MRGHTTGAGARRAPYKLRCGEARPGFGLGALPGSPARDALGPMDDPGLAIGDVRLRGVTLFKGSPCSWLRTGSAVYSVPKIGQWPVIYHGK